MLLKRLIISLMLLDNFLSNFLKCYIVKTRWVLEGQCKRCGVCCQEILLRATKAQLKSNFFRKLTIRWISWLFDFILIRVDYENNYIDFTCKQRTGSGSCGNYFWRPHICRNYPLVDYFEQPRPLPNCGFKAQPRKV